MKRYCFVILLVIRAMLFAQTAPLPDIEITGEARIKLPIRTQNHIHNNFQVAPDSLPMLIPHGTHKVPDRFTEQDQRLAYINGEFGSNTSTNIRASWYTRNKYIPYSRLDIINHRISSGWAYQEYCLSVSSNYQGMDLLWDAQYGHSTAPGSFTDEYRVRVNHNYNNLDAGECQFSNLETSLNLDIVNGSSEGTTIKHTNMGFRHQHNLRVGGFRFGNELMIAGGEPAISTSARISSIAWLTDIYLVLSTDLVHLLPSIMFQYPLWNRDGTRITVMNTPGITGNDRMSLLTYNRWAAQPQRVKNGITPLDLQIIYQKQTMPRRSSKADLLLAQSIEFSISQRVAYQYNNPVLVDVGLNKVPGIGFTDQWVNITSAQFRIPLDGFQVFQSLEMNLTHIKSDHFRLKPYTPVLTAETKVSRRFGKCIFDLGIEQGYFARDHQNKDLNDTFKVNITGEYRIDDDLSLCARIIDLFNTPSKAWKSIPGNGREAFLGLKYRIR